MKKTTITWFDLQESLKKQGIIGANEEIKELTLVKPRCVLIRTEVSRRK